MSGDIEHGKCDVCHQDKDLQRTYYYYGIKCDCHSPEHVEIVRHCADCKPSPPLSTKIHSKPMLNRVLTENTIAQLTSILQEDSEYREGWKANIAMAYIDNEVWYKGKTGKKFLNKEDKHKIANNAAEYFIKLLCNGLKDQDERIEKTARGKT